MTVEQLRKSGYRVGVYHTRRYDHRLIQPLLPNGGRTEVCVTTPHGLTVTGKARCSKEDTYVKKVGVQIALNRALEKLKVDKEEIDDTVFLHVNGLEIPVDRLLALDLRDQLNNQLDKPTTEDQDLANSPLDLVDLFARAFTLQDLFGPIKNEIPEPNQRKFTSFGSGGILPKDGPFSW